MYYLISFQNTHTAISTKKKLENILPFRTIPTLREVSANCGISLKIEPTYYEDMLNFFNNSDIDKSMFTIYQIDDINSDSSATKIKIISS